MDADARVADPPLLHQPSPEGCHAIVFYEGGLLFCYKLIWVYGFGLAGHAVADAKEGRPLKTRRLSFMEGGG